MKKRPLIAVFLLGALIAPVALVQFAPEKVLAAEFARHAWWGRVEKRSVTVGDTVWSYYEGGAGPPVVLVHGFTGSKENWLEMLRPLTAQHRVIVPDLPGWGETTRDPDGDYGIAAQVERIPAFLDALGLDRVHLVGHSMGGNIAGVFAATHPERLESVALVDAAGVHFQPNDFAQRVLGGATPFNFSTRDEFDAFMLELFESPRWLPGRVKDVLIERNKTGHAFHVRILDRVGRGDEKLLLEAHLDRIRTPTFVLWCRGDKLLDVSSVDTIKAVLKDADVAILEHCGHMPMMEKPAETAAAYLAFLAKR